MSEKPSEKSTDRAAIRDSEPFLVLAETRPVKPRRWRRWVLGIVALMLLAGGAAVQFKLFSGTNVSKLAKETAQAVQNQISGQTNSTALTDEIAGLALQGISLFNGEKGAELWRLKATWAHLSQEGDTILVDAPVVRYTLGEPALEDYLDVKSEKGKITDSQRYLTLTGNVDVRRMGDIMTGPRLNYDSKTRVMVFPEGAALESARATGTADVFTWDLNNNTMLAEGHVDVVLKPQEDTPENAATGAASAQTPPASVQPPTGASVVPAVNAVTPTPAVKTPTKEGQKASAAKTTPPAKKSTATKKTTTSKKSSAKTSTKKASTKKTTTKKTPAKKSTSQKKSTTRTSTTKKSAATTKSGS